MEHLATIEPIDYLVVGHITIDITPDGPTLGGTAAYVALNAKQHGFRVGIFTSFGNELPLDVLSEIQVVNCPTIKSTTFENRYTEEGRVQLIRAVAEPLDIATIPTPWKRAKIIHLAPVANEIPVFDPTILKADLLCATPQGWLRRWDAKGLVSPEKQNEEIEPILQASVVVLSSEDLAHDEDLIEWYAHKTKILAITEGSKGSRLYWNGDIRKFSSRRVVEVDPTGAGDIFASSFFMRLLITRDPWEASRYANQVAAFSVTRKGMASIPSVEEIKLAEIELLH
jgi:sugar/nucleoside kinase (ribokinase family)